MSTETSAKAMHRPPPAFPGMRIGLLGGSFNPPHHGHRHISLAALKRLHLDRLWWMVTPGNPLKSPDAQTTFANRLALATCWAQHPRIDITGFEASLPNTYTVHSLKYLKQRYPSVSFVWIMGADNLATFHLWRGWREIADLVPIAIVDRPGYRFRALQAPAARVFEASRVDEADAASLATARAPAWAFLSLPLADISSTDIRLGKQSA